MCLVNGEQAEFVTGFKPVTEQRAEEGHVAEAFGRDIDESIFPLREESQSLILFGEGDCAVDERGGDALAVERVHLVFHQRDERRDDEGQAVELQRGELVDERFSRARGHDGERVLFVEQGLNRLLLSRAEGGEAEVGLEGGGEIHERSISLPAA